MIMRVDFDPTHLDLTAKHDYVHLDLSRVRWTSLIPRTLPAGRDLIPVRDSLTVVNVDVGMHSEGIYPPSPSPRERLAQDEDTKLQSLHTGSGLNDLPPLPLEADRTVTEVQLHRHLSYGRLSDVFLATLRETPSHLTTTDAATSSPTPDPDSTSPTAKPASTSLVAVKIIDLATFSLPADPDGCTLSQAQSAVLNEARLYAGPLSELQGEVVPRFYGLFVGQAVERWMDDDRDRTRGEAQTYALVLEKVEEGVGEWERLELEDR